jgi:hypothetical protein
MIASAVKGPIRHSPISNTPLGPTRLPIAHAPHPLESNFNRQGLPPLVTLNKPAFADFRRSNPTKGGVALEVSSLPSQ